MVTRQIARGRTSEPQMLEAIRERQTETRHLTPETQYANSPIFQYASIPGHLFVAKPNVSDLAQRTRFLRLE